LYEFFTALREEQKAVMLAACHKTDAELW
jgi:hypothetical protein